MIVCFFSPTVSEPHETSIIVWLVLFSSVAEYWILHRVLCLHSKDKRLLRWLSIHLKQLIDFMMIDGGCCGLCICTTWCTCIVPLKGRTSWTLICFTFTKLSVLITCISTFLRLTLRALARVSRQLIYLPSFTSLSAVLFTVPPTLSGIPLPWPASK